MDVSAWWQASIHIQPILWGSGPGKEGHLAQNYACFPGQISAFLDKLGLPPFAKINGGLRAKINSFEPIDCWAVKASKTFLSIFASFLSRLYRSYAITLIMLQLCQRYADGWWKMEDLQDPEENPMWQDVTSISSGLSATKVFDYIFEQCRRRTSAFRYWGRFQVRLVSCHIAGKSQ